MTLHLAPVDLNFICSEAVVRARALSARHVVTVKVDPSVPSVRADSDRLFQVVSNLLSNAIKYSPNGGEVALTTTAQNGVAEVTVVDHGLGIPPDFLKKLFSRYERFENTGGAKIVGTGLGLAITRQIVEMHGGKIWVDSEVGKGSTFHFTIPVQGPETPVA